MPRGLGALLAALLAAGALALVSPPATALHEGETDRSFAEHYNIQGRIVNETGWPVKGVQVSASIPSHPQTMIDVTDCEGDYNIVIPTPSTLSSFEKVTVSAGSQREVRNVDPDLRRTDVIFVMPGRTTDTVCFGNKAVAAWPYRYTIEGRVVERIPEIEHEGAKLFTKPLRQLEVNIVLQVESPGNPAPPNCPPYYCNYAANPQGLKPGTDGIGNFQFSFIFNDEAHGGMKIDANSFRKLNVTVRGQTQEVMIGRPPPGGPDFLGRMNVFYFVLGDNPNDTPAAAAPLALAALAGAAFAWRRSRGRGA